MFGSRLYRRCCQHYVEVGCDSDVQSCNYVVLNSLISWGRGHSSQQAMRFHSHYVVTIFIMHVKGIQQQWHQVVCTE